MPFSAPALLVALADCDDLTVTGLQPEPELPALSLYTSNFAATSNPPWMVKPTETAETVQATWDLDTSGLMTDRGRGSHKPTHGSAAMVRDSAEPRTADEGLGAVG
jgi:hypothetical protein